MRAAPSTPVPPGPAGAEQAAVTAGSRSAGVGPTGRRSFGAAAGQAGAARRL